MTEYSTDRAALASLFPRGRFTQDDDRRCVLTARRASRARDFAYVQDPGRKLGIFYVGRGQAYRNALRDLILEEIEADGEGIIHAKWCAETAERLPWFNRQRWNGAGIAAIAPGRPQEARSGASEGVPLCPPQGGGPERAGTALYKGTNCQGTHSAQEVTP